MTRPKASAAAPAFARAEQLEAELLALYPGAWETLDHLRTDPEMGMDWPDWCLLPMGAPAALTAGPPPGHPPPGAPIAALSALYAWRFSRSVWLMEPDLTSRLLTTVPDAWGVDAVRNLPQWCIYVWASDPEGGVSTGLWIHLEHDANVGRPELRLLIDTGGSVRDLLPVPVYLDRDTLTEALADYRATSMATLTAVMGVQRGHDVHGGDLDASVAEFAEKIDGYVALAAYLSRSEADIISADRPGLRPVRPRRPMRDKSVWLVGYADQH